MVGLALCLRRTLPLVAYSFIVVLLATQPGDAAVKSCDARPVAGSLLYFTNRAKATDAQLYTGERALDAKLRAINTTGAIVNGNVRAGDLRPCSNQQAFFDALSARFVPNAGRQLLIYVPGYYTTFVRAAKDAIAVQSVLKFRGPVVLYSWPSKVTSRLTYFNDEANAEWSAVSFRSLLGLIQTRYPNTVVSFATHSLGARFGADGLAVLRHTGCSKKCFGRALLFAPDIDSDTLREGLGELGLCKGSPVRKPTRSAAVTLYVSNRDVALRQSQRLHGHQRAGQAGSEMILCSGVDTIDVGYHKSVDAAGHTYQTDPRVIRDAGAAFAGISPASPSRGLRGVSRPGGTYYELH